MEKKEYNEEMLTINAIAKKEGLKDSSLMKKYKETEDIYEAVRICKENQEKRRGTIEYNGEMLTTNAIAKKERLSVSSLMKKYKETGDIYEAVKICKARIREKIEYNGEMLTINEIAKKEGLSDTSLRKKYKETGDIYKAVRICKENQEKQRGTIEYKGEMLTINAIAKKEGLSETSLGKKYKETRDIYKAVFICKNYQIRSQRKKTVIKTKKYGEISYYDLSVILGIRYNELMNLINKGYKVDAIIKMNLKPTRVRGGLKKSTTKLPNGQTLREYCVENKLNYACIYRAINVYGKSLKEAVDYYKKNGQQIPKTWIFEKYGLLLRHIMLRDRIDIDRVVKYMREEVLSLEEAIEKYIVRKNAKKEKLDEDWMEEIYGVLTDDSIAQEYDQYKKTFFVDDKEEECVIQSCDEVDTFNRKMILFEIAEAIEEKIFTEEEEREVLKEYKITEKEIEIIFKELYRGFKDPGVLLGEKERRKRITKKEQKIIDQKVEEYKRKIKEIRQGQDEEILDRMKDAVRKNVGNNGRTRQIINQQKANETNGLEQNS